MKTYQDLQSIVGTKDSLASFLGDAVNEYKGSPVYQWAIDGEQYAKQQNTTIMQYQKILYTLSGKAVPDNWSANHKCASNFFSRFVTQQVQYLLGNGVQFQNPETKKKLDKDFDTKMQKAGREALIGGVSFVFRNLDHVEVFKATEFIPLWDEETGALMAGIRFWQIAAEKPMRITLFEVDGYTDFVRDDNGKIKVLHEKRPYKQIVRTSVADGTEIIDGGNYPGFPVVPLWGNYEHQSMLVGLKSQIDAYDLIKSGFANDLDDASQIYWIIQNAGGMDDIDLAQFLHHMKTVGAAIVEDNGASAEPHTIDIPYQSRETYLTRLENDMYNDAMALNVNQVAAGNVTATAIQAAYEPLNNKTDMFEYCLIEAIGALLELIGIKDDPSFVRSQISNQTEVTTMVISAAQYLDDETILRHLPFLSPDEVDGILDRLTQEESSRYAEMKRKIADLTAQNNAKGEEDDAV